MGAPVYAFTVARPRVCILNERAKLTRGIVSPTYGDAPIGSQTYAPTAGLEGVVHSAWAAHWTLTDREPHTIRMVSDPCVNIAVEAERSRIVGVWTELWERTLEGTGRIRALKLHSGAVRRVLDEPAHTFTGRILPLVDLFGTEAQELERRVLALGEADGMEALQAWLTQRLRPTTQATELAVAAVERVRTQPDLRTVDALADEMEMPKRTLQRLFREHVGASPKWVIRHHRLQEAATRLSRGELSSLSGLALELGYADQAHLTRDFRRAVGRPPSAFVKSLDRAQRDKQ